MPNIAKVFREEIARIARKEAKAAVAPIRKPTIKIRRDVADLKQRVAALAQVNKQLQGSLARLASAQPQSQPAEAAGKGWISGKGIKSLRKKLGVSQAEFAKLVGVSDQAVYICESKTEMLKLRAATKASVFAVRGIGAKEARKRLEAMKPKAAQAKRGKKISKRKK